MSARIRKTLSFCLAVAAAGGIASEALGAGFALREESAEGLGNAFAGQTAKSYNANAAFYNPAGMTRLNEAEVAGTATWIAPEAQFTGTNSSPLGGNVVGKQPGNAVVDAAVFSVFGVYPLAPDWRLGLSIAVPFGLATKYDADWVGRYQALTTRLADIEFSPTLAYRVDDHLSVGGGPRIDRISARLSQAINLRAIGLGAAQQTAAAAARAAAAGQAAQAAALGAQATSLNGLASSWGDGVGTVDGDDWGVGYTLGLLYEFTQDTRVGVNYRSRVFHELSGNTTYNLPATVALAGPVAANFVNQGAKAKVTLPDSVTVGFYHQIDRQWAVMSDVQWTHWSLFRQLEVTGSNGQTVGNTQENWRNTMFASVGLNYAPTDRWMLRTGFAYDQTPVKTAFRTARIPDSNRYWLALGASYALTPAADVHVSYAHLFADDARISQTASASSGGGTLTGTYKNKIDIVSASFAVRF